MLKMLNKEEEMTSQGQKKFGKNTYPTREWALLGQNLKRLTKQKLKDKVLLIWKV